MNASNTLTKPFLVGVLKDIRGLFPELDFSYEIGCLDNLEPSQEPEWIKQSSLIGKALDRALISGSVFTYPVCDFFPSEYGSANPMFLKELWAELLHQSGLPHFAIANYSGTLVSCSVPGAFYEFRLDSRECNWSKDPSDIGAYQNRKALIVLLLRQFFLGLSKLTSLECLCLGKLRTGRF